MPLPTKFGIFRKGFQFVVSTVIDDRICRLEEELKRKEENERKMINKVKEMEEKLSKIREMEGKYNTLQQEMARMKCLFTSVEVAVEPLKKPAKHM